MYLQFVKLSYFSKNLDDAFFYEDWINLFISGNKIENKAVEE